MRILRSLDEALTAGLRRPVVTLGVFDGVHIGHRLVLDHVVALARERAGDAVVVTFATHPRAVIRGEAPKLITSLPHRLRIFGQLGITAALVLEFDDALRRMPARTFAARVFGEVLRAELVLLGYNNRFGRGGEGDIDVLREAGRECGFEARPVAEVRLGGDAVSSTSIRGLILEGEVERASLMLGRPFSVLGTVVAGEGLGRRLGYPTANLDLRHEVRPPAGVYGCEVDVDGRRSFGLLNIGVRPTVSGKGESRAGDAWEVRDHDERVEVHLLDAPADDLYGKDLEVVFLRRLRPERKFPSLEALTAAIRADEAAFREWLAGAR